MVALVDEDGRRGYGEAAPIEAFGTESVDQAESFFRNQKGCFDPADLETVPAVLPCCRFAVECALADLRERPGEEVFRHEHLPVAGLLPAGGEAVRRARELWEAGYRTFKWKIAVHPFAAEREWFRRLRDAVPAGAAWRLDANGGLDRKTALKWGMEIEDSGVEFLEQPLPVRSGSDLEKLASEFPVPIALDESVGTIESLREWIGRRWKGVFVIKPALAGSPSVLLELLRETDAKCVFSSALETVVGMKGALRVAFSTEQEPRAVGWGAAGVFADDGISPEPRPEIPASRIRELDGERAWTEARS